MLRSLLGLRITVNFRHPGTLGFGELSSIFLESIHDICMYESRSQTLSGTEGVTRASAGSRQTFLVCAPGSILPISDPPECYLGFSYRSRPSC